MIKLVNVVLLEEYRNINKEEQEEEGAYHTEYIDDRQLLCMLDDEEMQARDKGGECDLISQGENFENDMSYLSSEKMKGEELKELQDYYEYHRNREIHAVDINQSAALLKLKELIDSLRNDLRSKSRTANLWLAYIDCINTLTLFIFAERTGDWNTHLVAVGRMLNIFAASGHFNYAKSARLYLQWMFELPATSPWLYEQFCVNGFHTVRRSDTISYLTV